MTIDIAQNSPSGQSGHQPAERIPSMRPLANTLACPCCGATFQSASHPWWSKESGTLWLPIPAFVAAVVFSIMALLVANEDHEPREYLSTFIGLLTLLSFPLALGLASLGIQEEGKGLAIAAISLCVISIFISFVGFL